jgi:AcrR family transcriptional regulator
MVRPRRLEDDVLLARITAALEARAETTTWSLADVAPAAGLSPSGLIKRFGSKTGLLRELTRRWVEGIPEKPVGGGDVLDQLSSYVAREFGADSPAGAVFAISEVTGELSDPELTVLLAEGWKKQAELLARHLDELSLGRLENADAGALLLLDALHGSLFRSAVNLTPSSPLHTLNTFLEIWK